MRNIGRLVLLAIAAVTFISAVPPADAQVVVVGRGRYFHNGHYYHHRGSYYRHHHRYFRYY